jgi:hypothetical protein
MDKHKIIATFEMVDFPDYGMHGIIAKIDTGAFTGALHCTKIDEHYQEGQKKLAFSPFDHPEITITTSDYTTRKVKSSNGVVQHRFFIHTNIIIKDETYKIELSLADRSVMKWPVLIGRRFLHNNDFLVDVNRADDIVTK